MLAYLSEWFRKLILLVLLAAFADLLLPSGNMQRYARIVLSLFLILMLLSPVLALLRLDSSAGQIPLHRLHLLAEAEEHFGRLLKESRELQAKQQQQILSGLETQLQADIAERIRQQHGLEADVDVSLRLNQENEPEFDKIVVYLRGRVHKKDNEDLQMDHSQSVKPVSPVTIEVGPEESYPAYATEDGRERAEVVLAIKNGLKSAYGLADEQIVIITGREGKGNDAKNTRP